MKLTYRRCGDYYLPNIGIPEEDMRPLGKYGRMRMRYLREHRSLLFNQLLLSGKLMKHLYSIDDTCQERLDLLIRYSDILIIEKAGAKCIDHTLLAVRTSRKK